MGAPWNSEAEARNRRLKSGILTSIVSRGVAAIVPLIMIPLTLEYLGEPVYGLWMALTALTGMVAFTDLGLGNGLMTKLSACYPTNDVERARKYVSNAYAMVGGLALTAVVGLLALRETIPWVTIFNAEDPAVAPHAADLAAICLVAFLLNVPLSLCQRVLYAYQRVGQSNVWQMVGGIASIPLVIGAVGLEGSPESVIVAALAGPMLCNALNSLSLYCRQFPEISPHPRYFDLNVARELLGLGGQFLLLTAIMSVAISADNIIIARTLGLEAVTTFAVPARLFAQLGLLVSLVNLPLWPANGEALARGDAAWVKRTTRRMTLFSGSAITALALVLVVTGDKFLAAWLGADTGVTRELLAALGVWWALQAAMSPVFMVQNSVGVVRPQLLGWFAFLVVSVPLKSWLAGVAGAWAVPAAGAVCYALLVVPSAMWGYQVAISRSSEREMHPT